MLRGMGWGGGHAGENRGFGLHTDLTDGLILQLEGVKLWDVCGMSPPDLAAPGNGVLADFGVPHKDAG